MNKSTDVKKALEICLEQTGSTRDQYCLGYYDGLQYALRLVNNKAILDFKLGKINKHELDKKLGIDVECLKYMGMPTL